MELPTLRTIRLVLEPVRGQDTEALHATWTDPDVRRHLWDDEIISRDRALATVEATLASAEADGVGRARRLRRSRGQILIFARLSPSVDSFEPPTKWDSRAKIKI